MSKLERRIEIAVATAMLFRQCGGFAGLERLTDLNADIVHDLLMGYREPVYSTAIRPRLTPQQMEDARIAADKTLSCMKYVESTGGVADIKSIAGMYVDGIVVPNG